VFDDEGFFHTGDIVEISGSDMRSGVVVVDRKKNIFKLASGEYLEFV